MLLTKANVITVFVGSLKELGHVEYQRKSTDGEQKFDDSFPQSIDVISGIAVVDGVMNCHVPERIQSYECHIWFCGTFWLGLRPLTRSIKQTNKLSRHWKTGTVFENHRKKSHSTLRAKRATFTFYSVTRQVKNWWKCQKWKTPVRHFGRFSNTVNFFIQLDIKEGENTELGKKSCAKSWVVSPAGRHQCFAWWMCE